MRSKGLASELAAAMEACLAQAALWPGAVAVSGGGDSVALMVLLKDWSRSQGRPPPIVLTVDHGLTTQSGRVAAQVVGQARELGLRVQKLKWTGRKPQSGLEASARAARYGLMGEWCVTHGLRALYVAHTQDDQAETFMLRLARGSGLDGLAAMRPVSPFPLPGFEQLQVVRPLLAIRRSALRQFLASRKIAWVEDPMNSDPRFARVRMREALPDFDNLGLSVPRLASTSMHLARARDALENSTNAFVAESCRVEPGRIILDGARLTCVSAEIGLRVLAQLLGKLSGAAYRPRFDRLERLYRAIVSGELKGQTLQGCRVGRASQKAAIFGTGTLVLTRERPRTGAKKASVAALN